MKKIHIAIAVNDLQASICDYSKRLGAKPEIVVPEQYALWRTETINFSIRKIDGEAGVLRHLGWEDDSASEFTSEIDANGILWENFNKDNQRVEIEEAWPGTMGSL